MAQCLFMDHNIIYDCTRTYAETVASRSHELSIEYAIYI